MLKVVLTMKGRSAYLLIIILFGIAVTSCSSRETVMRGSITNDRSNDTEQIYEEKYHKDGIEAIYPKFKVENEDNNILEWNRILEEDIQKILQIYTFNPFPELTPQPAENIPTILYVDYDIKLNNDQFFSVLYKASFRSPYSAHPTELVYTTNIDKKNNKRIRLSDISQLNTNFVKNFRSWNFRSFEEGNEELNRAIIDFIDSMSDLDLMMGFQEADQIGSDNLWGIYSYLTAERLGISIGVPHYIGDHVEFENDYSNLMNYLNTNYEW